jgi:pyruvate formate lyase activating enzyme
MKIGGLQRFSLIDYPGKICAIVFTQGCNFRCPYCHNPELANPEYYESLIPEEEIFSFLERRKGKLDAVSITGGEPTEQSDLLEFISRVKTMDYLVKIDTNGSHPEILESLIEKHFIDYVAMDVKAPPDKYRKISRSKIDPAVIKESIKLIRNSQVPYEFRTTIVKSQLDDNDIVNIAKMIKGADCYVLQKFVPSKVMDPRFLKKGTYSDEEFARIKKKIVKYVQSVIIR